MVKSLHMNCSVVIPVYRGETTITALVERLAVELPKIAQSYEVILVNDSGPDLKLAEDPRTYSAFSVGGRRQFDAQLRST